MSLEEPSEEDRQAVLAEVQRLHDAYLEARSEFERVVQSVLEGNQHGDAMTAIVDAANARELAFGRYVAAAAKSGGED